MKPGEKTELEFNLTGKDLEFPGRDMKPVIEPGEFEIFVGNSSVGGLGSVFHVVSPDQALTSAKTGQYFGEA
ncbi:fibronectin type III-like domain-contianing protein, partial [Escherichia coli]|nr:fibronectin type III-like domain-contianing protein [Escherichia coli]